MTQVVIVGGGFAGLTAAKDLGKATGKAARDLQVTVVDRRNHHLFQPLLYQVAMAGLSPAEIAAPIRSLLSAYQRVRVRHEEALSVDLPECRVLTDSGPVEYDYLILGCGTRHAYFGNDQWEEHAPGLKSIPQALEIRRRVLTAYERAETENDRERQRALLTFVVIGGGPTGIELAGALGEMSRFTLARDFRNIDPTLSRVILLEAGPRILPTFHQRLAQRVTRDLESLGVQVWTSSAVTDVDGEGVEVGRERIQAATTLWAAGVQASELGRTLGAELDRQGRVVVTRGLTIPDHPKVFVLGDMAHVADSSGEALPGLAPVAMQQGHFAARAIFADLVGKPRGEFRYRDKGQMATIGRSRAIVEFRRLRFAGFFAWVTWLLVHVYFLVGFKNRLFVVLQWAWAYLSFRRGARLIVKHDWKSSVSRGDEP